MDHARAMLLVCCLVGLFFVPATAFAANETGPATDGRQTLVIPGSGDSQAMLAALAKRFSARHPDIAVVVPDSIGSSGGIAAVRHGQAALGRVARPLSPEEQGASLVWRVFALSPVVFVANLPPTATLALTSGQIVGIYSGAINDYAQLGGEPGKIYPVMRERGDSSLGVLQRHVPGFKDIRDPRGKVYYTTPEVVAAISDHPGALGYVPLAAVQGRGLLVFSLDGIRPTPENVRRGAYRLVSPLALIHKGDPKSAAKAFLGFVTGPEAVEIIRAFGCVPARGEGPQ